MSGQQTQQTLFDLISNEGTTAADRELAFCNQETGEFRSPAAQMLKRIQERCLLTRTEQQEPDQSACLTQQLSTGLPEGRDVLCDPVVAPAQGLGGVQGPQAGRGIQQPASNLPMLRRQLRVG